MFSRRHVFARLALSSFLILPLIQGRAVFAQTVGPKLDSRSQRSIPAGPYSAISTAFGGLDTVIPFFSVEGPNGTKLDFAIRHRSNQAPGTSWGVLGGSPGAGWFHNYTDSINISTANATQYSTGNTLGEWNIVNYSTATSVPYDRRPTTRDAMTVYRATSGGNITRAEVTTLGDRTRWIYDKPIFANIDSASLKLGSIVDACGNTILVNYNTSGPTSGLWSTITDASSVRSLVFSYKLVSGQYVIDTVSLFYPSNSKTWNLNYDSGGRLTSIQFPPTVYGSSVRPTIVMDYTAEGNIANLYDLKGNHWHYNYSSTAGPVNGTLVCNGFNKPDLSNPTSTSVIDPNGTTLSWATTNPSGSTPGTKTCSISEPYGNVNSPSYRVRKHVYDNGGVGFNPYFLNPIRKVQDPLDTSENANFWETYNWNYNDGTVATYGDRRGKVTNFTYDTQNKGQIQTVTDPLNKTTTYIWNDDLLVSEVLPTQDRTIYGYNYTTRKLTRKIVDPSSDFFDPSYSRTQAVALRTEYKYTVQGELASVASGTLSSTLDYTDSPVTYSNYDAYGNARTVKDAAGVATTFTYDDLNNKGSVTPPSPSGTTTFAYDNWNRLIQTTFPGSVIEKTFYDNNNNVTRTEDGNSNWTDFIIDPLNRVTFVTRPTTTSNADNIVTCTAYDAAGRAIAITNGRTKTTGYIYNERDLPIQINYPDGTTRKFRYDGNGNKYQFTNGRNQVATYTYDERNSLTNITYGDGFTGNVTNHYRDDGLRDSMTDSMGTSYWTYDHARRVSTHFQPGPGKTVTYTYDNGGRLASMSTGTSNMAWAYQYDTAYRLQNLWQQDYVRNSGVNIAFVYNPNGSLGGRLLPNRTQTYFDYDTRDRVTKVMHWDVHPNGTRDEQHDLAYTYDNVGNISTYQDVTNNYGVWKRNYFYDRTNRLIWEADADALNPNYPIGYAYDKNGNRTGVSRNGAYTPYYVDDNDRLSSGDGYSLSSYDADGNPGYITGFPGFSSLSQTYDMMSRLRTSAYGTGGSNQYKYDGDGKRVERKDMVDATKTVRYLYNESGQVIADTDGSGTLKTYYIPGINMTEAATGKQYYVRENGLGSQVALTTDVNGGSEGDNLNIVSRTEYDSFGREYDLTSSTGKRGDFRFAGKHGYVTDTQSGLQLLGARYYLPVLGRFLTQDPSGQSAGLNLYAYCNNNPLSNVDPSGLHPPTQSQLDGGDNLSGPLFDTRKSYIDRFHPNKDRMNGIMRGPDYMAFNLSAGFIMGWSGQILIDKYWNFYIAPAGGFGGHSPGLFSASLVWGWVGDNVSERDLAEFAGGWSDNYSVGYGLGMGFTSSQTAHSGNVASFETGFYTPQISISSMYDFGKGDMQDARYRQAQINQQKRWGLPKN